MKRQARWSDWGKQATRRVSAAWGGRRADGMQDVKKPRSFFGYVRKKPGRTKMILIYPTSYKKRHWPSYGKKYER